MNECYFISSLKHLKGIDSRDFLMYLMKVHEEGDVAMQKLPNLKEAGSCSLSKRNDGAWCITLPDEKKRKLNG